VYLAVQVRHSRQSLDANTAALEEDRKLSIANAYQARTALSGEHLLRLRDSPYIEGLSGTTSGISRSETEWRYRAHMRFMMNYYDNVHFQYQQGFVAEEYYERAFVDQIKVFAPSWRALDIVESRESFEAEVDRILIDSEKPET
jgi:hypothetical protein